MFEPISPHWAPLGTGCPQVMVNDDLMTQVAELAELIVDEVSKPDQDWERIADWARALAELTAGAVPPDA